MPVEIKEIYAELKSVSDRISTQVRTVALSVLALTWLFLVGGKNSPVLPSQPDRNSLVYIGMISLATLVADYLQYFFGYLSTNAVRKGAESVSAKTAEYDYTDTRYRLRVWLFWTKQFLLIVAVIWLFVTIGSALLSAPQTVGK